MDGRKIVWVGGALLLVAAVGGCTGSGKPAAEPSFVDASAAPHWSEPAAYRFVLTRGCDAGSPLGRYQVAVRDGAVTGSTRLDHPDAEPSASADAELGPVTGDGEEIDVPTLKGLLGLVQTASDDGGQTSEYFDGRDGHPVKVSFNTSGSPTGTECFAVTDYTVGG